MYVLNKFKICEANVTELKGEIDKFTIIEILTSSQLWIEPVDKKINNEEDLNSIMNHLV